MKTYIFKAPCIKDGRLAPALEVGIVFARTFEDLYWALDESRDPHSCLFKPFKKSSILSIQIDLTADNDDFDYWDTLAVDTVGDRIHKELQDESGWLVFEAGKTKVNPCELSANWIREKVAEMIDDLRNAAKDHQ